MDIVTLSKLITDTGVSVVLIGSAILAFFYYFRQKLNLDKVLFLQRMELDKRTADRNEENDKMQNKYREAVLKQSENQISATNKLVDATERNTEKLVELIGVTSGLRVKVDSLPTRQDVEQIADEMRKLHAITHEKLDKPCKDAK